MMPPAQVAQLTVPFAEVEHELLPTLQEHGCAIVSSVLSPEDCLRIEGLFAEDLADVIDARAADAAGGEVRHVADSVSQDPRAWPAASMELLGNIDRCQLRGFPHGRFAWECRLHPNVRRCYEVIHGRADLVSSCDNPFFSPSGPGQAEGKFWPHVDHNSNDRRFFDDEGQAVGDWEVYQGALYVWGSESPTASTTVVLPGSQAEGYEAMMRDGGMVKSGRRGKHFCQVASLGDKALASRLREDFLSGAGRVPVPAGGLFLWSSKTLHQGWAGGARLAQPVCWEPVGRRDEAAFDRKLRLAALGLPSNHWASMGTPHSLVKPQLCGPTAAARDGRGIALPARPSIHLASLRAGVEAAQMWEMLKDCEWDQQLPDDLRTLVDACLSERVRDAL